MSTSELWIRAVAGLSKRYPIPRDRFTFKCSILSKATGGQPILEPAEEPAHVTEPNDATWFYEHYSFADRPASTADRAALQQLHRGMDSGYQPYVFCCGGVGDHEDLVSWEHRVPITAEVLVNYRLMPGQIIDAFTYQRIASELVESRNKEALSGGDDFLDRLQN